MYYSSLSPWPEAELWCILLLQYSIAEAWVSMQKSTIKWCERTCLGSYTYCTSWTENTLSLAMSPKTRSHFAHVQTVCTRPSFCGLVVRLMAGMLYLAVLHVVNLLLPRTPPEPKQLQRRQNMCVYSSNSFHRLSIRGLCWNSFHVSVGSQPNKHFRGPDHVFSIASSTGNNNNYFAKGW